MKSRRNTPKIMLQIKKLLEKNKPLSIRQISLETRTMWNTTSKSLKLMQELGLVEPVQSRGTKLNIKLYKWKK